MAHSKNRTSLAVLRSHLGHLGGEHELASIIGRSPSWVNKASSGRIYMTRDAALRISMETGVCPEWLLQNDPSTVPVAAESGVLFDNAFFKKYRANLVSTRPTMVDPLGHIGSEVLPDFVLCLARHFQAVRSSPRDVKRLSEWLKHVANGLEHEFPISGRLNSAELERAALDLCRLTARAWTPRRKGYNRTAGTASPEEYTENVEYQITKSPQQTTEVGFRKLTI